ncbi:hypothetical protein [Rhodanobacter umsongensis]
MCDIDWSQAPAWVQAIGSVAAIIIAVVVGNRSAKQARKLVESERRRQADIVASTMSNKFHLILVELSKKIELAETIAKNANQAEAPTTDMLANLFLLTQHDSILQMRSNVIMFDRDTGILANTAIDVLESYNPTISTSIAMLYYRGSRPEALVELCQLLVERMQYLSEVCTTAEERLEIAHELDKDSSQLRKTQ